MAIFITGATGNSGYELIELLLQQGIELVAGVRNPEKSKLSLPASIVLRRFDFADPSTFASALQGIDKVYLMRPPALSDVKKYIAPFIDACVQMQVKHVVFLSLLGVEKNTIVPHYKIEKLLLASGLSYTFLRAGFFMQNLSTTHRDEICFENGIWVPAGRGATSFIDVRDIAEVAALALTKPGHENKAYDLTGSQALTYAQIAETLSDVLGRTITYYNPGIFTFFRKMRTKGLPVMQIVVMIALYSITRMGKAGHISNQLEQLLGRKPRTFVEFARDHASTWQR